MTGYLLDTNVVLWSQLEPHRLGASVAALLDDAGERLWISPLSIWEIALLVEKRRVQLDLPLRVWTERFLLPRRLGVVPLSMAITWAAGSMHFEHGDPMDRLLAATALVERLTLLTADRKLLQRTDIRVLAAGCD